jgi:hypothetical protein
MCKRDFQTIESYFRNDYLTDGKYDFPVVKNQVVDLSDLTLIRFSNAVRNEHQHADATVHFFEEDEDFDEVWKNPSVYLDELKQYRQVFTPDFSLYTDMPLTLQLINTFRNRWCGAYWQEHGLTVIPTITWSDEWSYEFCFDAVEKGTCVAVTTLGCSDVKELYMAGFAIMCRVIDPACVICYASPFEEMNNFADIIEVPYSRNGRIAVAKRTGVF